MVPPVGGGGNPSPSSLARLMFGNKAPSLGKSKSKASAYASSRGSKRKATRAPSSHTVPIGASGSSSTPIAERISIPSDDTNPSGGGDGSGTGGDGSGIGGIGTHTKTSEQEDVHANPILDEDVIVIDDGTPEKKRSKNCTSAVWQYISKKNKVVEVDGNKFVQLWGYCNFPKCQASYRAECHAGTSEFWNHLRSAHSVAKGQTCLKAEKDHEKVVTVIQLYKYDPEGDIPDLNYRFPIDTDIFPLSFRSFCVPAGLAYMYLRDVQRILTLTLATRNRRLSWIVFSAARDPRHPLHRVA